jgi:hypothetical protein
MWTKFYVESGFLSSNFKMKAKLSDTNMIGIPANSGNLNLKSSKNLMKSVGRNRNLAMTRTMIYLRKFRELILKS